MERCLTILKTEVERSMALLGVKSISEINESHLVDIKRLNK
ncbi:alpha-hydroxy-acid oxidizing protein [Aestuariicella hydrocarbonica]